MLERDDFRNEVIRCSLVHIELWSMSAEELLMGTAAVESKFGYHLLQTGGPALGVFQMEPFTHDSLWNHQLYYRPELAKKVYSLATRKNSGGYLNWRGRRKISISGNVEPPVSSEDLITNFEYASAMARIKYLPYPMPLPPHGNINKLGRYWKNAYNTNEGAGTVDDFVHYYKKYVQGAE